MFEGGCWRTCTSLKCRTQRSFPYSALVPTLLPHSGHRGRDRLQRVAPPRAGGHGDEPDGHAGGGGAGRGTLCGLAVY